VTGLHSRGYRPKPGERLQRGGSGLTQRELWSLVWHHLRGGVGVSSLRFGRLARECLDAREAPDPLLVRAVHVEVGATRAEAVEAYPLDPRYEQGQRGVRLGWLSFEERVRTHWGEPNMSVRGRLADEGAPLPLAVGARLDELGRDLGLVRTDGEPDADFRERLSRSPLQGLSVTMRLRGTIDGA
jgi:hypothetical protein